MKFIRLSLLLSTMLLISLSVNGQHCSKLPAQFDSQTEAIDQIKKAEFEYTDRKNIYSSSWLQKAEFFSCDGVNGFLVYHTIDDKMGIHANVPKIIWKGFKKSDSKATYYNDYIKDRYALNDDSE